MQSTAGYEKLGRLMKSTELLFTVSIWAEREEHSSQDAYTGARLAEVGAASDRPKTRRLQLRNPDLSIPFDYTGKM